MKYSDVTATEIGDLPSRSWPKRQLLQADKEGRVFLLREDTLELYRMSATGGLVPKGRLVDEDSIPKMTPIFEAAMSPSGGDWVLYSAPNLIYIVHEGKVLTLDAPWKVSAVAMDGGEPVVAVAPGEMNTTAPTILRLVKPPLLQKWDGKRWNTLAEGTFPGDRPDGVSLGEFWRGEFSAYLCLTSARQLWMADQYAYRLRHFSSAGTLEDELSVKGGMITWSERSDKEWARLEKAAKEGGLAWSRRSLSSVRAEETVRALTIGPDGAVYLLVSTKEGLALDRYHPALASLDRLMLKGIEVPGRIMMAGGKDGIYIAAWAGKNGVWFIDTEKLDGADWRPVPDAVLNGQALVPPVEKAKNEATTLPARPLRP